MSSEPSNEAAWAVSPELQRLRSNIDNLDAALVYILSERFKCTKQAGELKARIQYPPADPDREAAQVERLRKVAEDADLDPDFGEKLVNFIIKEVIRPHEQIREQHKT